MSHTEEQNVEMIGVVPSVLMVVGGLLVAIFPLLAQLYLLAK